MANRVILNAFLVSETAAKNLLFIFNNLKGFSITPLYNSLGYVKNEYSVVVNIIIDSSFNNTVIINYALDFLSAMKYHCLFIQCISIDQKEYVFTQIPGNLKEIPIEKKVKKIPSYLKLVKNFDTVEPSAKDSQNER